MKDFNLTQQDLYRTLKAAFNILEKDFAMTLIKEEKGHQCVLTYKNNFVQVELAASNSYFHAEIRRLVDGIPAKYSDKANRISFEDLAIFESNNNYEHFDYYAGGGGLENVVKNSVELFQRNKDVFITSKWIDTSYISRLKDEEFEKKFGFKPNYTRKRFVEIFEDLAKEELQSKGFKKILDNRDIAPYLSDSLFEHTVFSNGNHLLKASISDWRDNYNRYYLELDGKKIKEVDILSFASYEDATKSLMEGLQLK